MPNFSYNGAIFLRYELDKQYKSNFRILQATKFLSRHVVAASETFPLASFILLYSIVMKRFIRV